MAFLKRISPEWALRIGLGTMFLYSGVDIFRHPSSWTWAVPIWFTKMVEVGIGMPLETYMRAQAVSEVVLALVLLAWFIPRKIVIWFALLATVELAGILFLGKTGIDPITFRDLGALGAAAGLYLLLLQKSNSPVQSGAPAQQ